MDYLTKKDLPGGKRIIPGILNKKAQDAIVKELDRLKRADAYKHVGGAKKNPVNKKALCVSGKRGPFWKMYLPVNSCLTGGSAI